MPKMEEREFLISVGKAGYSVCCWHKAEWKIVAEMILSHKIRLVTNKEQELYFMQSCGVARFTYNWALNAWKKSHEAGEKPSGRSLKAEFNAIRRVEFPWTFDVHRDCTSVAFTRIQSAFSDFFRRVKAGDGRPGFPKFKKKGKSRDSFYISNDRFRLDGKKILMPKIGWIKMRECLRFPGKIMSAVVSRVSDQWFVAIAVDTEIMPLPPKAKGVVGVDLGISALATMSDGRKVHHSDKYKKLEKQVRRFQKSVSRKQKGSASRRNAVFKLSRKHYQLACLRSDTLHKLTTGLVENYQGIVIEDLNVKGMVKNHCLASAISRQGWFEIRRELEYKCKIHGRDLTVADRFYPSTKTCSGCGEVKHVKISERVYKCPACGLSIGRDLNAAINLSKLGAVSSDVKPVEMEALAGHCLTSETAICEAGTGFGWSYPDSENRIENQ